MGNSKGPYYLQLGYHSGFGPHSAQIPMRAWQAGGMGSVAGDFIAWDDELVDADDLVNSLADLLRPFYPESVTLDNYIIFKQVGTAEIYTPVAAAGLTDKGGTFEDYIWNEAVEETITWRSTNFGIFKITLLDAASGGDFSKLSTLPSSGILKNLHTALVDTSNPYMARDNGRPSSFISRTFTLNERLRRSYHQT